MNVDETKKVGLDSHSPVPLYYQLKNIIEEQIGSGEYQPGEMIPSENQLCKLYDISRTTARQAITELVNTGRLVRTQGRGTFVSKPKVVKPTYRLSGFTQDMKELGKIPVSKILQFAPLMPLPYIRDGLNLEENEAAIILKRLRFAGTDMMGLDISYFPFKRFIKLLDEELENHSLYKTLESKFDIIPSRSLYNVESLRCPREIADLLEVSPGEPVLFLREIVFDQNEVPFEFSEEYYRADRYTFRVDIRKNEQESFKGVAFN